MAQGLNINHFIKNKNNKSSSNKSSSNKSINKTQTASPNYKNLVGKMGWCDAQTLGLSEGHYVFIRSVNGDKCDVNTLTSIRDKQTNMFVVKKMEKVEDGIIYPIPLKDCSLPLFGGVHKNAIKDIPINKIQDINKNTLHKKHHYYIKRYL